MPFLIPLAGLALGALGRLIKQSRTSNALQAAGASTKGTSSEPSASMSTSSLEQTPSPTVTSTVGAAQVGGGQVSDADRGVGAGSKRGPEGLVPATQPATGPVQQNTGADSPTPAAGDDAGLAARLGRESVRKAKLTNRLQTREVRLGSQALQ